MHLQNISKHDVLCQPINNSLNEQEYPEELSDSQSLVIILIDVDRQTYWIEYESLANGDGVGAKEDETWSFHFEIDALKSDYLDRKERNKE